MFFKKNTGELPIVAQPVGSEYGLTTEKSSSNIYELSYVAGLRVVVATQPRGSLKHLWLEYYFPHPRGFRMLDESDMLGWWKNKTFHSDHHLYEITEGGWLSEDAVGFSVTKASMKVREWLITSSNDCVSVIASEPPLIRELLTR